MIKKQFVVVFLAAHLTIFATSASAQTATFGIKDQGINSYDNSNSNWNGVTGYIGCLANVDFNNAYSGNPSDPPMYLQLIYTF